MLLLGSSNLTLIILVIVVCPRAYELVVKLLRTFRAYEELTEKHQQRTRCRISGEYECVGEDCSPSKC